MAEVLSFSALFLSDGTDLLTEHGSTNGLIEELDSKLYWFDRYHRYHPFLDHVPKDFPVRASSHKAEVFREDRKLEPFKIRVDFF